MKYKVGVTLRRVEEKMITDDLRIEFRTPRRKLGEFTTRFAGRRRVFKLEARDLEWPIFCRVTPTLYRGRRSPFTGFSQEQEIDVTLLRRSDKWKAKFLPWATLRKNPAEFGALTDLLVFSKELEVESDDGPALQGSFTGKCYNSCCSLAKGTLLNIYKQMRVSQNVTGDPWTSHLKELEFLWRERIIAQVDKSMFDMVREIRGDLGNHPGYEKGTTGLHIENIPAKYVHVDDTSIKTTHDFANLQLSVFKVVEDADRTKEHYLLDADLDENGNLLRHLVDVFFIHPITGGTHPHDIHEFLMRRYPEMPIGYSLVKQAD